MLQNKVCQAKKLSEEHKLDTEFFTKVECGGLRDVAKLCKIADALHVDISKIIVNE